jgi:hypothetical protein
MDAFPRWACESNSSISQYWLPVIAAASAYEPQSETPRRPGAKRAALPIVVRVHKPGGCLDTPADRRVGAENDEHLVDNRPQIGAPEGNGAVPDIFPHQSAKVVKLKLNA